MIRLPQKIKEETKMNQDQIDNSSQQSIPKKHPMKHGLMMLACCLIPILLIIVTSLFGLKFKSLGNLAFLICPLVHVVMMIRMRKAHGGASCCAPKNAESTDSSQTP